MNEWRKWSPVFLIFHFDYFTQPIEVLSSVVQVIPKRLSNSEEPRMPQELWINGR
jgi:hypothetical protein